MIKNEWSRPPSLAAARQFTLGHPSWVIYALSAGLCPVALRIAPAGAVFRNYLPSHRGTLYHFIDNLSRRFRSFYRDMPTVRMTSST